MIPEVAPGIFLLELPIPGPLESVNCYLVKGAQSWSIVDTGPNFPDCRELWQQILKELEIPFHMIKSIVCTHSHVDHFGLAGWLQQQSGAVVYLSEAELADAEQLQKQVSTDSELFKNRVMKLGLTVPEFEDLLHMFQTIHCMVHPMPKVQLLTNGLLELGDREWEVIISPGHSVGHACLYNHTSKIMFSGDQVLPTITSAIRAPINPSDNPLRDYLNSLARLKMFGPIKALPAHGGIIHNLAARIDEITCHHDHRLQLSLDCLSDGEMNVREVAARIFGNELDVLDIYLATGEMAAHLSAQMAEEKVIMKSSFFANDIMTFALRPPQ